MAAKVITLRTSEGPTGILNDMSGRAVDRLDQVHARLEQISAIAHVAAHMEELSPVLANMLRGLETMLDDTIDLLTIQHGCARELAA